MRILKQFGVKVRVLGVERASKQNSDAAAALSAEIDRIGNLRPTHEVRFAREVADRVIFMADGQIVEQGRPDDVLTNPQQERTKRFLRMVEHDEMAEE